VTSQALKYDVIAYTPYEGLNYTVLEKITPLWKRIGEPPEIQIGCYRGDPGHQRHSDSSNDLFWLNKTVRRLCHWNFHLLSFWLALSLPCDVTLCDNKWQILMITSPLLSNVRHRAMITPVRHPLTRLFILARVVRQFIVCLKLFSKWELSIGLNFKSNVLYKSIASKNLQSDMNDLLKNT